MTLPTVEKTWQFNVNNFISSSYTYQRTLRLLKDALVGFASSPWTIWGCGNTSTFGNGDGVDRWTTDANLVWGTPSRSWIVLQQTGLNAKTALCLDLASMDRGYMNITLSPDAGFGVTNGGTDGTATTPPTSTDGFSLNYASLWGGYGSDVNNHLHVMQSTDGECTRAFLYRGGTPTGFWIIDRPKDPVTHWTSPVAAGVMGTNAASGDVTTKSYLASMSYNFLRTRVASGTSAGVFTYEAYTSDQVVSLLGYPDDQSYEYPLGGIGVYFTSVGRRGRKGSIRDLWWGPLTSGNPYPDDGSKQFMQIGSLVVPWDGASGLRYL